MSMQDDLAWVDTVLKDLIVAKAYGKLMIELRDGHVHLIEKLTSHKPEPPNSPIGASAHGRPEFRAR